jgi:two-component system, OmpR family, sensor kinase
MGRKEIKIDLLVHDLKNPLAVIQAGLDGLLTRTAQYGPLTPKQENVLARLMRNTRAAQLLVNDVLELGKSAEGIIHRTEVPVARLVAPVLEDLFDLTDGEVADRVRNCRDLNALRQAVAPRGLSIRIDDSVWGRTFLLDAAKIRQILRNLLSNAFKHKKERVELACSGDDSRVRFSVKDDGQGIPASYHQKIFDSYFQMDSENAHRVRGHGIGLAGVLQLVKDLEGELELISDTGRGAEFKVDLPV